MGRRPQMCVHGVLGRSKCRQCTAISYLAWYARVGRRGHLSTKEEIRHRGERRKPDL